MAGTVERAYQLAPECSTIEELRAKLTREQCTNVEAHLQGSLRYELKKLLKKVSDDGQPSGTLGGADSKVGKPTKTRDEG